MIGKVLTIYQRPSDYGFVLGLKDRLGCQAELIATSDNCRLRQKGRCIRRREALRIWDECRKTGADLIIRLTDADDEPFRDVLREEASRFPDAARDMFVCGVCDSDVEHWMAIDHTWAAERLGIESSELPRDRTGFSGVIKNRIRKLTGGEDADYSAFVAQFVRDAPPRVMRCWLEDASFSLFYGECVRLAKLHDCVVNDERK